MYYEQDSQYTDLATAIALLIYRRCIDHGDGIAEYQHFGENQLGVPADALARLGVMRAIGPDKWLVAKTHVFKKGWHPATLTDLVRHAGEPSVFDLITSLCLLVDWDSQYMPNSMPHEKPLPLESLPQIDLCDQQRFATPTQKVFDAHVFRLATEPLVKLGLGHWSRKDGFKLIFSLTNDRPIGLSDTYMETRHNIAVRLGGVEKLFPQECG